MAVVTTHVKYFRVFGRTFVYFRRTRRVRSTFPGSVA